MDDYFRLMLLHYATNMFKITDITDNGCHMITDCCSFK